MLYVEIVGVSITHTRNLQINDLIYDLFFIVITTFELLQGPITLDKLHKILVTKENTWHQIAIMAIA